MIVALEKQRASPEFENCEWTDAEIESGRGIWDDSFESSGYTVASYGRREAAAREPSRVAQRAVLLGRWIRGCE